MKILRKFEEKYHFVATVYQPSLKYPFLHLVQQFFGCPYLTAHTIDMLVLYETALGYCLFKVTDSAKIESADLWKEFESPEKANKLYYLSTSSTYYSKRN